jgi:hypothetical protein
MKSTDVTEAQMVQARQFLRRVTNGWVNGESRLDFEVMARILAWYGEIRHKGGEIPSGLCEKSLERWR